MSRKAPSLGGKMPPQAYTKDVLASAIAWLFNQPESLKQNVKTSDDLVGYYLKSVRSHLATTPPLGGEEGSSHPSLSSTKNFRNELQGLAQNLKQFEDKPDNGIKEASYSDIPPEDLQKIKLIIESQQGIGHEKKERVVTPPEPLSSSSLAHPSPHKENLGGLTDETLNPSPFPPQESHGVETLLLKIDDKTKQAIDIAKRYFNLSSDKEAIRLLVAMGKEHLQELFKDKGV